MHPHPPFSRLRSPRVPRLGAWLETDGASFRVWAPTHHSVELVLEPLAPSVHEASVLALQEESSGFFFRHVSGIGSGARYRFRVDGRGPFPDAWSRSQPDGVHGASELVDPAFPWTDQRWAGLSLDVLVLYELHVGTATPEGTFEALLPKLGELRDLGVTALELMPVSSFPGGRGWGYDGVFPFAPHAAYGGATGLKRLVDAAHRHELGVILDVVYNHLGPDGNYLGVYSPQYFTERHHTPWGAALNFDQEGCAVVREWALRNAEMWISEFHLDGLRLDATHTLFDEGQPHLLEELALRARLAAGKRRVLVMAEDDRNERRLVLPKQQGGLGLDAVWADDFHHALRRAFAGDSEGYFEDYRGTAEEIVRILRRGWFYEGQRSLHLGRPRGTAASDLPPTSFIHCLQNHDQVGNRAQGDRLGTSVSAAAYRAMSALLLLSPYTPLLFMGQEWNAQSPFLYFTEHTHALGRLVTEGRRREFAAFVRSSHAEVPDPQAEETFGRSKLDWQESRRPSHAAMRTWYRELLHLRASRPALRTRSRDSFAARTVGPQALVLERTCSAPPESLALVLNLGGHLSERIKRALGTPTAEPLLFSEEPRFGGVVDVHTPLRGGRLELEGPSALLLRLPAGFRAVTRWSTGVSKR